MVDLSNYLILPGRAHGTYEYSDLLVGKDLLSYDVVKDSHPEFKGNQDLAGDFKWHEAIELNLNLGNITWKNIQLVDLLTLMQSGRIHDGTGRVIEGRELEKLWRDFMGVKRIEHRVEWIDTRFIDKCQPGNLVINYDHRLVNDKLQPEVSMPLAADSLDKEVQVSLGYFDQQGMPTLEVPSGEIRFFPPFWDDESVTSFGSVGMGAFLRCNTNPHFKSPEIGIRPVKIRDSQ